jgi:hypothetical protein
MLAGAILTNSEVARADADDDGGRYVFLHIPFDVLGDEGTVATHRQLFHVDRGNLAPLLFAGWRRDVPETTGDAFRASYRGEL